MYQALATMSNWIPGARKIEDKLWKNLTTDIPKFGNGDPQEEKKCCKEIATFIACYGLGGIAVDKRRFLLPSDSSIINARETYIKGTPTKTLEQDMIGDEHFYIFGEAELNKPLTDFSNNCQLNLSLFYGNHWNQVIVKPFTKSKM